MKLLIIFAGWLVGSSIVAWLLGAVLDAAYDDDESEDEEKED